jgi:hypothetical protein
MLEDKLFFKIRKLIFDSYPKKKYICMQSEIEKRSAG